MSSPSKQADGARQEVAKQVESGSVDELTRLLAIQLKYSGVPQGALVHDLTAAGLEPARIAELIHTTRNTVSQQKRKPRPAWPIR